MGFGDGKEVCGGGGGLKVKFANYGKRRGFSLAF
jgi:hypothetical protein